MKRIAALLFASFSWLAHGASAETFDIPPKPAAPRPLTIEAPIEQTLANGLRVIVAHRSGVPLVSSELVVLSGSEVDPPQRAGLAAMTAGLLTQGTRHHSAPQLAAAAESLGGSLGSAARWNRSLVSITVTTPKLDAALGLVAEVATEPTFAVDEIDRLRTQTLDQLKVSYASPGALASLAAERLVYGNGAYGHPAEGTPASLPRIDRASVVDLHRTYFRPDNAVLVLAGDITAADAWRLARKHFGRWKAPPAALPAKPTVEGAGLAPTLVVVDVPGSGQAVVVLALALPPRAGDDRATSSVMNAVLGGGYSSRLNQEIRIKRGLSYGAGSRIEPRARSALFRVSVQTKNESAADVVGLVQAELDRLGAAPVAPDELSARKATLIGDFSRSVETTAGLGAAIAALVVEGLPPADLGTRIDKLSAVTPELIQRYAAARLDASGRRVVVAGEASRFAEALKALPGSPTTVTVKAADLDLERPDGALASP